MGCSTHSWGTAEDWNTSVSSNSRQIHGPAPETSVPDVVNLSHKPRHGLGLGRLLRGAHHHISTLVRLLRLCIVLKTSIRLSPQYEQHMVITLLSSRRQLLLNREHSLGGAEELVQN